jgi:hypothetical protein
MLALPVVLFVSMIVWGKVQSHRARRPQPVSFSPGEVRATLSLLGKPGGIGSNALRQLDASLSRLEVLPAKTLFSSNSWGAVHEHLVKARLDPAETTAQWVDCLLRTPGLLRASANGWLGPEDFGLTPDDMRRSMLDAPDATRRQWLAPQEIPGATRDDSPAEFTSLNTDVLARRVLCLKRLGCLDAVDGRAATEILLKQQVLSEQLPAGRRKLPFPKLLHGLFLTAGSDPIQDTYDALVVLENFGALNRVDREACIVGILRFHHGNGLFKSLQPDDGLTIGSDSRDTFWAFESLRMLGALDRVTDLGQWIFRPRAVSKPATDAAPRIRTWEEIEAWVCQQRLARSLREHKANPSAPVRSLLDP